jgi:Peptidase family M28
MPHPQGSEANLRIEDRIREELAGMGYSPAVQQEFVCGGYGTCGTVRNILARLPGREEHGAVLLSAHYDSVEAGSGASDDGLGVASVLEIARILRSGPVPTRPIVFLLDDGEEQGLLGAEAFSAHHPWAKDISAAVNLEARGTSGASLLFETSDDNRWLIGQARAIPHPVSTSVFPAIYRMLPNDTDLTVFKRRGMDGVNFACIGTVAHYHTPLDDLAHVSPATLQHQGDNALAMVEALSSRHLSAHPRGDAVFFDLLGWRIVGWPQAWTAPLATLAVILLAAACAALFRKGRLRISEWARAFFSFWGMIVLPALVSLGARRILKAAGILPSSWTAHPFLPLAGLWLLVLAAVWAVALVASRRCGPAGLASGIWSGWAVLGALAIAASGMSFLFLVPLLAGVWRPAALDPERGAGLLAPPLAAFLWLPMAWRLWEAVGFDGIAVISVAIALPATALVPVLARLTAPARRVVLVFLVAVSAAALLASIGLAPFSAELPQRLTIFRHEDADTGRARWIVEGSPVPPSISRAAAFRNGPTSPFPWSSLRAVEALAPSEAVAPPEFLLEEKSTAGGKLRFRGRIVSPRGASFARISFPPATEVQSFKIGGVTAPALSPRALARSGGWKSYACVTLPRDGIEVEAVLGGGTADFVLLDRTPGVPSSGRTLLAARPATAVPSQTGDASIVTRRIRF